MTPIEKLTQYTVATGSPFPFSVEVVADLGEWEPKARCVAIAGDEYRVHADVGGELTAQMLRCIVSSQTDGLLTEWVAADEANEEEQDPESE